MEIKWFEAAPKGRQAKKDDTMKLTFTARPKGVRFNAVLTRHMKEKNIEYVQFGTANNKLFIKPSTDADSRTTFKMTISGKSSSAQVCASAVGVYGAENGLLKQNIEGVYDQKTGLYEFDLSEYMKAAVAASKETLS